MAFLAIGKFLNSKYFSMIFLLDSENYQRRRKANRIFSLRKNWTPKFQNSQ